MNIKDQYKILEFGDLGDERGKLVVVEGAQDIPFEIKRVFYICLLYTSAADHRRTGIYGTFLLCQ